MPTSITSVPRSPALEGDPNFVGFTTTIPTATQRPGFLISGVAAVGDELNLRWGNSVARLTFAAAPDNSGTQLRAADGQTLAEYLPQLLETLYSANIISSAFSLSLTADGVRLVLRDSLIGDLNATSSPSLTVTIFGGSAGTQYPNLSAILILYRVGQVDHIGRFQAAYNRAGMTQFDLSSLLGLRLGLPTLGGSYAVQQPGGFAEYYFRYADQYGNPPQPERLTKSANFVMLAGGSAGDSQLFWGGSGNIQLCHSYFTAANRPIPKPISPNQPDWVWLYVHGTASATPTIEVTFSDGTTASRAVSLSVAMTRGLYCFPSGPKQCSIHLVPGYAEKEVLRYTFTLAGLGPSVVYDMLPCPNPWEVFLAYENGAAGIETVAMRGKADREYSTESKVFRSARAQVGRSDEGAVQRYQVEGGMRWTFRSGYYSADYIEHLRQLGMGRVWLIDQTYNRFIELLPSGGSLRLTKDDDDLHALEASFTVASPDRGAHRL